MASNARPKWFAQRIEDPIDPDRAIIDAHHHLWRRHGDVYAAKELLADTRGSHNVTHSVFVECGAAWFDEGPPAMRSVGETNFVVREARVAQSVNAGESDGTAIGAIVGHVDLTSGAAVDMALVAHDQAGEGLFRGVRHGTNWSPHGDVPNGHVDPTESLMADPMFRSGVATVGQMGFTFDAWLYFDQLAELAEMALAVPQTVIVLNHLGGPLGIGPHASEREHMLDVWRTGMSEVARCPNVMLKVGGIGMDHYFGMGWADLDAPPSSEQVADHWHDIVHRAIDAFGPDRCMFESNYPVDRQTLPYPVLWNTFQILADRYSPAEQQAMFHDTAARVYRIELP